MREIWLIRHGESKGDTGATPDQWHQIPRTTKGIRESRPIAECLQRPPLIIISPYGRAKQTAQPTIERFPETPIEEWAVQEYPYLSPVRCHGIYSGELLPWIHGYWERSDLHYNDGDGAESFADLMARVDRLSDNYAHAVTSLPVFSHGEFLRSTLWYLLTSFEISQNT